MIKRLLVPLAVSLTATVAATYYFAVRPLQRTWGVVPGEAERPLPGDDIVPGATVVETRGIDIEAKPAEVWSWLVQMGYGRAGWYSYDRLDNRGPSVETVVPDLQTLSVGDIVPTHPAGGFRVDVVDPEHALVLYLDSEMVQSQQVHGLAPSGTEAAEKPEVTEEPEATAKPEPPEALTPGLKVAGAVGGASMPQFKVSWAFVLEPKDTGGTRLIERYRVESAMPGPFQRIGLPLMGMGVFFMTRKQMIGIKERAERHPGSEPMPVAA